MFKNNIFIRNILLFLLFYLITIVAINYIYYLNYIKKWPEIIFQNGDIDISRLPFGFDQVTNNLINNNGLLNISSFSESNQYLSRMPVVPLYIKFIYIFITKKFFFIILIKNLFFFMIIIILSYLIFKDHLKPFLIFILLSYNFHNIVTLTNLVPEEGFTGYLIIILFLINYLNYKNKQILIAIVISTIFFTKPSMVFLCYSLSLVIGYLGYKKRENLFYLPLIMILLSYLIWSSYSYEKVNKFLNPFSLTSIGGQGLNIAYNKYFNNIYPEQSGDILESYIFNKIKKEKHLTKEKLKEMDELTINKMFIADSVDFIKNNPKEVVVSYAKKIYNIFFNLKNDGKIKSDNEYNKIRYSNISNKILLNLMIIIIIKNLITNNNNKNNDVICIAIIATFVFPYIIAIAYSRQIVPLYILAHIYIFFHIINKWQIKRN